MHTYMQTLEIAIQHGMPVLLKNVHEKLDPSLDPILNKSIMKIGRLWNDMTFESFTYTPVVNLFIDFPHLFGFWLPGGHGELPWSSNSKPTIKSCDGALRGPWTFARSMCCPLIHCLRKSPASFNHTWYIKSLKPSISFNFYSHQSHFND